MTDGNEPDESAAAAHEPTAQEDSSTPGGALGSLDWWLADRTHPGPDPAPWVLGQWPNVPALLGGGLLTARWLIPAPPIWLAMGIAGRGALIWWGVEEVRSGVNPLRRVLGGGMIATQLALLPTGL